MSQTQVQTALMDQLLDAPSPQTIIVFGLPSSGKTNLIRQIRDQRPRSGGLLWWRRRRIVVIPARQLRSGIAWEEHRFWIAEVLRRWHGQTTDLIFHVDCCGNNPVNFLRDWLRATNELCAFEGSSAAELEKRLKIYVVVAPLRTILERNRRRPRPPAWIGWERLPKAEQIYRNLISELTAHRLLFSFVDTSGEADGLVCFPGSIEDRFWEILGGEKTTGQTAASWRKAERGASLREGFRRVKRRVSIRLKRAIEKVKLAL